MPKSGKIICATFFAKSLDKMAGRWYNGISGPGARGGAANYTTIREFCQVGIMHKNRVEKFSTRNMKFSVNRSDRKSICVNATENLSVFQI